MPSEGIKGRQFARGAVRGGLQYPLAAAHDREKGHRPFFAAATGQRFGAHWPSIARDFYRQVVQDRRNAFSGGVKMNFSGATKCGRH